MYKNLVTPVISTRVAACFSFSIFALSPAAMPGKRGHAPVLALNPHANVSASAAGTP
jgi:hypothetical protein